MRYFALLIAIVGFLPSSASAQEPETEGDDSARHHFRLGQAHYDSGHFREAAAEFEQSYELSGRPQLLYNIYVSYRDANDSERARDALRTYLEAVPDAPNRSLLRSRLAALEGTVGPSESDRPDEPDASEPEEPDVPSETDSEPESRATGTMTAPDQASSGGTSPLGFIIAGGGAALLLTGAITGGLALSSSDDLAANCPLMRCPADYDHESAASTGSALAVATDVLIPVGAAALLTGVILILVLQGDDEAIAGMCGPGGCTVGVRF